MNDGTAARWCQGPDCSSALTGRQTKYCSRSCERRRHRLTNGDRIREQEKASKDRHRDEVRVRNRKHYADNPAPYIQRSRTRYAENRDEVLTQAADYYERNAEQRKAYASEYRKNNREKCNEWNRRYRAFRTESGEVVMPAEVFARDNWVCGICRSAIDPGLSWPDEQSASIDHVVPRAHGGAHVLENVRAAHLNCNKRKSAKLQ